MECGGKDAMIVDADADLAAAADAAAWGGVANAGQTCVGIERVYVVDSVRDAFLERLGAELDGVRAGSDADASYGPITMPSQVDVIRSHVDDGLARGGSAALGGAASVGDRFVAPIVLTDVPEDSPAVAEETFGPVIVVNRVRDADEAVERANASGYGLGGAVFAKKRGVELARQHAQRNDLGELDGLLRVRAGPSLRRDRIVRLRPHPRGRRAARVQPPQGDHPPARSPSRPR